MAKFKITFRNKNPFRPINIMASHGGTMEIEAEDEQKVKAFWKEAKSLPKFCGLRLVRIEEIE